MAEGNLKLQKAIIVAEAAASIGQIIMNTQIANAKAGSSISTFHLVAFWE